METPQSVADTNRRAVACTNHRMGMIGSERVLVNPKYDNGTNEPGNVLKFTYAYKCQCCGLTNSQEVFVK